MNATLDRAPSATSRFSGVLAFARRMSWTTWIGVLLIAGLAVAALLADQIAPYDPSAQDILGQLAGPSPEHWFGQDYYGRDILSRLIHGARYSLTIGVLSILVAMVLGCITGMYAGYYGGRVDVVLMQVMDVVLAFPSLILGLALVVMMGATLTNIVIAIAFTAIPAFARIARAGVMSQRDREYVQACRALGYSDSRILFRHILPSIIPEVLVMASLWMASAVRTEASLAFIGLGLAPPTPTWGGMAREGFENILTAYHAALFPSLAILVLVLAFNLIGDGLRDAIDPRMKETP